MDIEVKQEHIDKGERGCKLTCPVALAVLDFIVDAESVSVSADTLKIIKNGVTKRYRHNAGIFINAFDAGAPTIPFTVTLERLVPVGY